MPTPLSVPRGIALRASFSSPLMLAPAMMPVTAGKKIANAAQNPAFSKPPIKGTSSGGIGWFGVSAIETSERPPSRPGWEGPGRSTPCAPGGRS